MLRFLIYFSDSGKSTLSGSGDVGYIAGVMARNESPCIRTFHIPITAAIDAYRV